MILCARSCFLFLQSKVQPQCTQDTVGSAKCLHSNCELPLTAGHHFSVLLHSILIHGVTSVQRGVPQVISLEQPLPAHSEILTCAALQLITVLN